MISLGYVESVASVISPWMPDTQISRSISAGPWLFRSAEQNLIKIHTRGNNLKSKTICLGFVCGPARPHLLPIDQWPLVVGTLTRSRPASVADGNVICKLNKCKHHKTNQLQFQGLGRHTHIKDARSIDIKNGQKQRQLSHCTERNKWCYKMLNIEYVSYEEFILLNDFFIFFINFVLLYIYEKNICPR